MKNERKIEKRTKKKNIFILFKLLKTLKWDKFIMLNIIKKYINKNL